MNGARWLAQALVAEGVDTLFGYPGGTIMPFYDALHGTPALKHVLVRHEQGAAFAANGYARASGRVGVCVATSGPGGGHAADGQRRVPGAGRVRDDVADGQAQLHRASRR